SIAILLSTPSCSTYTPFFFLMLPRTPTSTLFPYTTLFRSLRERPPGADGSGKYRVGARRPLLRCHSGETRTGLHRHDIFQNRQRSEEHTSELQSPYDLVCRVLLAKKKKK